jgi:hypothetical protein
VLPILYEERRAAGAEPNDDRDRPRATEVSNV